jgi:predicted Zn-dependent peptidase
VFWLLSAAHAAPAVPKLDLPRPAWSLDLYEICLPSGLLVDIVRRPEAGVVAVTTVVGGGSAAETDATRGAAHLTEHLWFQSRPDGGPRIWDRAAGLQLDGATETDATVYATVGSPDDLAGLLALEVARLEDPLRGVTEEVVVAEQRVVASELQYRGEHSARAAIRWLDGALWPADHPYAASITSLRQAGALDLAAVRAYVDATYRPEHTAIRIEGDVDPDRVSKLLQDVAPDSWLRGDHRTCTHPSTQGDPPPPPSTALITAKAPTWRPHLYLGWSLPAAGTTQDTRIRLAVAVLDEIVRRAVGFDRQRGTDEVEQGCTWFPGQRASKVVCEVEFPSQAAAEQSLARIRGTLDHQWIVGEDAVRNPVIRETAGQFWLDAFGALDDLDADALATRATGSWRGVADPAAGTVDTVYQVTVEELAGLARKWLGPERMAAVLLVPGAPPVAAGQQQAATDPLAFPELPPWKPAVPRLRPVAGTLENGLTVWSLQRTDAPYVARASLVADGGWATSPVPGASEVLEAVEYPTFPTPWEDVRNRVPHDLTYAYRSSTTEVHLRGPADSLDVALWAQHHLTTMSLDMESRQQILDNQLLPWLPMLGSVAGLTTDALRIDHLLPLDRASRPWWDRTTAARLVTEGQALTWQRTVWRPSTSVLVVTSPLDPARVRAGAESRLASWKEPKKVAPPAPVPPPAAGDARTWILEGQGVLSSITAACRVPARTEGNAAAFAVLGPIVDRALFQSLRDGLGLYVAEAGVSFLDERVGLLEVRVYSPPDRAAAVVDATREVLRAVHAGTPAAALSWGQLAASAELTNRAASARRAHGLLLEAAREGRSPESLTTLRTAIGAVTAADLTALLADCAGHEAVTVLCPNPPGLDGEHLDWVAYDQKIAEQLR